MRTVKHSPKHSLHHPSLKPATRLSFRLERWHRRVLYGLLGLLLVSGLLWLWAHYFLTGVNDFGTIMSPLEHWSMQLHGAIVFPFSFIVGSLLLQHMRRAHKAGANRVSGWSMVALLSILALTGYGLYYLASEESRPWWSLIHWLLGCSLPILICLHILLGRRTVAFAKQVTNHD